MTLRILAPFQNSCTTFSGGSPRLQVRRATALASRRWARNPICALTPVRSRR